MPDIVTSQTFSDGEKGITATKMNNIIANSVIQPDFVISKPSSSTLDPTDQLLEVKGAGTYARITGSQLISSVSAQVDATPQIYSARLRSYNAVGNSNFSVDQRSAGAIITVPNSSSLGIIDRWFAQRSAATLAFTSNQGVLGVDVPGTNFRITNTPLVFTLTAQQTTLAASDNVGFLQNVEGPMMRPLIDDVHSLSILAFTNISSGLKFTVALRDSGATRSLVKLCTIPTNNTWTLITLPNIPVWGSGGGWSVNPGVVGYTIYICYAAGSTLQAPAADVWNTGNYIGLSSMDNIGSKPTGSFVYLAAIQHEPGSQSSTLMDVPFSQNYDAALRYFQKSYDLGTALGTVTSNGALLIPQLNSTAGLYGVRFAKPMAKVPAVAVYNHANGALNTFQHTNGSNFTVTTANGVGQTGWQSTTTATLPAASAGAGGYLHFMADSGW